MSDGGERSAGAGARAEAGGGTGDERGVSAGAGAGIERGGGAGDGPATAAAAARRPGVLYDFGPAEDAANPYTREQLLAARRAGVDGRPFSWPAALFGRYDVFHVNWPESLVRARSPRTAAVKSLLALALVGRLRMTRTPVVRTVHNLVPHSGGSRVERLVAASIDRRTVCRVFLNESPENERADGVVILHGEYAAPAQPPEQRPTVRRLLFFGLLRPFKGIETLIEAVDRLGARAGLNLTVAGLAEPENAGFFARLEAAARAAGEGRVELINAYLPEERLERLIDEADAVVLPYRYLYNSGAALLALSRGRRILVPDTGSTRALRDEVGADWVHLIETPADRPSGAPLDAETLAAAIARMAAAPPPATAAPELSRRRWEQIGCLHAELYRTVIAARQERRTDDAAARIRAELAASPAFLAHSERNALE